MSILRPIAAIVFFTLIFDFAFAQQAALDCEQQLTLATDEFNAGRFYGVAAILKPCLDGGFSREQRQRANLLLTQAYLLLDDPVGADRSYVDVLWANPEFEADTVRDPIDLVYLSRKYTADPIFSLFARVGGNTSPVRVIHSISPSGEGDVTDNYDLRFGFHLGGGFDWHFAERLTAMIELNYQFTQYYKTQVKFVGDRLEVVDRQRWITLPIAVKYLHPQGRLKPFAFAGLSLQWLLTDRGQIKSFKTDQVEDQSQPITIPAESPTLNLTSYRNAFNQSIFVGGGLRYKVGLDYVFGEMRYGFGLKNVAIPTSTFDTDGPMVEWGHTDDYFRMDNFSISAGYVRPLYRPRKLKQARTKSILRGINRKDK